MQSLINELNEEYGNIFQKIVQTKKNCTFKDENGHPLYYYDEFCVYHDDELLKRSYIVDYIEIKDYEKISLKDAIIKQYKLNKFVEEEISMAEFAERFLQLNDLTTPVDLDINDKDIEVETEEDNGKKCWKKINSFLVKEEVDYYYTDGKLKGTDLHRIIENDKEIYLKDHQDFKRIDEPMKVVDIEVDGNTYLANGRLNHNTTTPGGWALGFYASLRIKLSRTGYLTDIVKINGKDTKQVIGIAAKAKIVKSRIAPPFRECAFNIYYSKGIDDASSWMDALVSYDVIKRPTLQKYVLELDGRLFEFKKNEWYSILYGQGIYDKVKDLIIQTHTIDYNKFGPNKGENQIPEANSENEEVVSEDFVQSERNSDDEIQVEK